MAPGPGRPGAPARARRALRAALVLAVVGLPLPVAGAGPEGAEAVECRIRAMSATTGEPVRVLGASVVINGLPVSLAARERGQVGSRAPLLIRGRENRLRVSAVLTEGGSPCPIPFEWRGYVALKCRTLQFTVPVYPMRKLVVPIRDSSLRGIPDVRCYGVQFNWWYFAFPTTVLSGPDGCAAVQIPDIPGTRPTLLCSVECLDKNVRPARVGDGKSGAVAVQFLDPSEFERRFSRSSTVECWSLRRDVVEPLDRARGSKGECSLSILVEDAAGEVVPDALVELEGQEVVQSQESRRVLGWSRRVRAGATTASVVDGLPAGEVSVELIEPGMGGARGEVVVSKESAAQIVLREMAGRRVKVAVGHHGGQSLPWMQVFARRSSGVPLVSIDGDGLQEAITWTDQRGVAWLGDVPSEGGSVTVRHLGVECPPLSLDGTTEARIPADDLLNGE